ncbi:hypothetical protein Tco_1206871, partial [Tanacetum coccineum]
AHIDLISTEIDEADFDPEEEIRLVEKLLYDNSSPRPPNEFNSENSEAKPPDDDDVYFDIEPDTGVFTKVVDDISDNSTRELYVHVPNVLPTQPTLSPHLLSHQGFKAFQDCPDLEASRARGFVLRSLELHILSFIMGIQYPNLID